MTDLDSDGDENTPRVTLMTIHSAKGLEFPTVFVVGMEENLFPSPMSMGSARELEEERRLLYVAITRAEKHCILTYAQNRYRYGKMEFNPPSRFLRDIDQTLITVDDEDAIQEDTPVDIFRTTNRGFQNSRPVATQFRADPKPRIVGHQEEQPSDPFSARFKRTFTQSGGNLRRVSEVVNKSARPTIGSVPSTGKAPLQEGNVIEHERFGIGKVLRVEGSGENTKATVEFRNTGVKQLLLKFARYKVVKKNEE